MTQINLITNADDFGLTESICDAIETAFRKGILTSTTLLASSAHSSYAAAIAQRNPGLSVGVHLQLVAGEPVTADLSKIGTLITKNGNFYPGYLDFFKSWHLGKISASEIKTELINQIKKIMALGITPSHADSHQHVHMHPSLLPIFIDALKETGIRKMRDPVEPFKISLHKGIAVSKGNAIKIFFMNPFYKNWFRKRMSASKILCPDSFFGQFYSGAMTEDKVAAFIDYLERRYNAKGKHQQNSILVELMTHPGSSASEYENIPECDADFMRYRWADEFSMLLSPALKEKISEAGIKLCGY